MSHLSCVSITQITSRDLPSSGMLHKQTGSYLLTLWDNLSVPSSWILDP